MLRTKRDVIPLMKQALRSARTKVTLSPELKPMTRQFVHISPDYETAVKVGRRHGKPVILKIRARDFKNDGNELYRSSNGVWQAKAVPPEYFKIVNCV